MLNFSPTFSFREEIQQPQLRSITEIFCILNKQSLDYIKTGEEYHGSKTCDIH